MKKQVRERPLTNENLVKKFRSNFDLVTHAIDLAEQMILAERVPLSSVDAREESVMSLVLEEIAHEGESPESRQAEEEEEEDLAVND